MFGLFTFLLPLALIFLIIVLVLLLLLIIISGIEKELNITFSMINGEL